MVHGPTRLTVLDPGLLFANPELQYDVLITFTTLSYVVFLFKVSIFCIFERSTALLILLHNFIVITVIFLDC